MTSPTVLKAVPALPPVPPGKIEIWFDYGSTYSYLSVMRIEGLAAARSVGILWRPFLLGPIFKELGWQGSPFLEQKEKLAYMWRDMARQCEKYGLPWTQPTAFPRAAVLPLRLTLACADEAWVGTLCRAIMQRNFAHDKNIDQPEDLSPLLLALGQRPDHWLASAQSEWNKLALRHQTEHARALGIFGGPSFVVGDQLFWGNDRMEDALDMAMRP